MSRIIPRSVWTKLTKKIAKLGSKDDISFYVYIESASDVPIADKTGKSIPLSLPISTQMMMRQILGRRRVLSKH